MNKASPDASNNPGDNRTPFDGTLLSASLTVKDLPSSLAWYRDVLGFSVDRTFDRGGEMFAASLRGGTIPILLTQDDGVQGLDRKKGAGISLRLTTRQNIDDLGAHVRTMGMAFETEPMDMRGVRMFRLRDLDGFLLVISSEQV